MGPPHNELWGATLRHSFRGPPPPRSACVVPELHSVRRSADPWRHWGAMAASHR
jgi:hypothetical protein